MKFTLSDIPVFRSDRETPPQPRFPADESVQDPTSPAEIPDQIPVTPSDKFRELFIPPDFMSVPPPSWKELLAYAKYAPYPGGGHTGLRTANVWYTKLVALPVTLLCRAIEWTFQRPARLLIVGGLGVWAYFLISDYLAR